MEGFGDLALDVLANAGTQRILVVENVTGKRLLTATHVREGEVITRNVSLEVFIIWRTSQRLTLDGCGGGQCANTLDFSICTEFEVSAQLVHDNRLSDRHVDEVSRGALGVARALLSASVE